MELQRSQKEKRAMSRARVKKRETRARIKLGRVKNRSRTFFVLHRDGISGEKETNYAGAAEGNV